VRKARISLIVGLYRAWSGRVSANESPRPHLGSKRVISTTGVMRTDGGVKSVVGEPACILGMASGTLPEPSTSPAWNYVLDPGASGTALLEALRKWRNT
jgi:hypothetical protein